MGHVYQDVTLSAVRETTVRMLVDTGATFSLISPDLADELGVARLPYKDAVTLVDGQEIQVEAGTVRVQIGDREAPATVWIGACDVPLLGVETLEVLGLVVDPSAGALRATRAFTYRLGGGRGLPAAGTESSRRARRDPRNP